VVEVGRFRDADGTLHIEVPGPWPFHGHGGRDEYEWTSHDAGRARRVAGGAARLRTRSRRPRLARRALQGERSYELKRVVPEDGIPVEWFTFGDG
jgi:hypothetical protein